MTHKDPKCLLARTKADTQGDHRARAITALMVGATCIGIAPIFVRFSEVGPAATAFYRMIFALPFYWLLAFQSPAVVQKAFRRPHFILIATAGICFAGDLIFWHWSLKFTSVANSTLLTNIAPIFVLFGARFLLHEKPRGSMVGSMALAIFGAAILVGTSAELARKNLCGDTLAAITAIFYAGYILALKKVRGSLSTPVVMGISALITAPICLLAAIGAGEDLLPETRNGWMTLIALGLVSHLAGQGLIVYSLAHLPATFSAATLLWQPVVAALLAIYFLQEPLSTVQLAGGSSFFSPFTLPSVASPIEPIEEHSRIGVRRLQVGSPAVPA